MSKPKVPIKKKGKEKFVAISKASVTEKRNLTPDELNQYIEMEKLCNAEIWKLMQVKNNTAIITGGQLLVKQLEDVVAILGKAKEHWVSQVLLDCGIEVGQAVSINKFTGEILLGKKKK